MSNKIKALPTPPRTEPKKTGTRVTVEWVDGYHRDGKQAQTDIYEGESVGVNQHLMSTIAIPLVISEETKDGKVGAQKTVFLPHTFIKSITFEKYEIHP